MKREFIFCFLILFFINHARASYYDTLPKGINNFTFRFVQTGTISGSYNNSGDFKGYNVNANINADTIKGINAAVDTYLGTLSATDYKNFSFGTFEGNATSKVSAQVIGIGYGISDKATIYGYVPFYNAVVDLNLIRTSKGQQNVGTAIQLNNLPNVDAQLIQSIFVNYYGYKPLGRWQASNFGDTEIGLMYQVEKWKNAGALINLGVVAPTGRKDDPDILQDIAFGDGQWDAFYEFGGGYHFNSAISGDLWTRFTYQFPYQSKLRCPNSQSFQVTSRTCDAQIKLGNKVQLNADSNYAFNDQWGLGLIYTFEYKEKDKYQTIYLDSNDILETNTTTESHLIRFNLSYSTIKLYKQKLFILPLDLNLAFQSYVYGKNIPKYNRGDLEVRFYF